DLEGRDLALIPLWAAVDNCEPAIQDPNQGYACQGLYDAASEATEAFGDYIFNTASPQLQADQGDASHALANSNVAINETFYDAAEPGGTWLNTDTGYVNGNTNATAAIQAENAIKQADETKYQNSMKTLRDDLAKPKNGYKSSFIVYIMSLYLDIF